MPAPVSAKSSTSGKTRSSRRSSNLPINFEFNTSEANNTIRVVKIDGEPWFVAADVLRTLGSYLRSNGDINTSHIKRFLNDDEYRIPPAQIGGRTPLMVNESGLYKVIMRSDEPVARPLQDWVTRVVLPSIRKHGGYIMGEEKVAKGEMTEDEMILKTFDVLQKKCKRYEAENKAMEEELTFLTIQQWAALNYLYPSHSDKTRLSYRAKHLCIAASIEIKRIERTVNDAYGRTHPTYSNIYPRHLIDQAAMELGMVESVRPVSALH